MAYVRCIKILTWFRGFTDKIAVSQFPEETWTQRKPNQVKKNDQKAWDVPYFKTFFSEKKKKTWSAIYLHLVTKPKERLCGRAKLPTTPNEKLKNLNFDDKSKKLSMRSVAQLPLRINFK